MRSVILASLAVSLAGAETLDLTVKAGVPLHVRVGAKTPVRAGQPVEGVLAHPVWVFDREVLPAGTKVTGRITKVRRPGGAEKAQAYLRGRLRTRKDPVVSFDLLTLADGRRVPLRAAVAAGMPAVVRVTTAAEPAKGRAGQLKEKARSAVANHEAVRALRSVDPGPGRFRLSAAGAATRRALGFVGGRLRDEALSYWPFGTQRIRAGTSYASELLDPLEFGTVELEAARLRHLGKAPPPDAVVSARLTGGLTSKTAVAGMPIRAAVDRPVFSAANELLIPEGAILVGEVVRASPARRFGRNGNLRLRFKSIETAQSVEHAINATLQSAEAKPGMKIDAEGGAFLPAQKRRFLLPAIAGTLALASVPDDEASIKTQGGAPGWSGLGLGGTAISLAKPSVAGPLGWAGVATSVYFNLIRKANELELPANTRVEIRLGRPPNQTTAQVR